MKYILLYLTVYFAFTSMGLQAQKTSIAVFPFVYAMPEYRSKASQMQGMVVEILNKKSNINGIDRSMDTLLMKELDYQIREQSIASKDLVQQGKVIGASNMIVGTISNVKVETQRANPMDVIKGRNGATIYKAYINFSLQLLDVESGKILKQKTFDNKEGKKSIKDLLDAEIAQTPEAALVTAMKVTRQSILSWLNESYPPDIKIVKIEDRDKKGFPETILVTGIDAAVARGAKLSLNEVEMVDVGDGKKLRRSRNIADLKVSEIQGEIAVCKITNGEKVIEAKMNSGAKLEVQTVN